VSIVITALSVVVPVKTLDALWPGGEPANRAAVPNRTYRCDGHLTAVAFMTTSDLGAWVEGPIQKHGLTYVRGDQDVDLVVVDQMQGPVIRYDWLEFRPGSTWSEARFAGAPEVPLAGPPGWSPDAPGVTFNSPAEIAEHFEFIELRDRQAVFRDDRTGKLLYMGVASKDGPEKLSEGQRRTLDSIASEASRMLKAAPGSIRQALFVTGSLSG
jgi:hypothetical protein